MDEKIIITDLKNYIENNILAADIRLDPETNLQDSGIDSFSTIEIILFIERTYGVAITDENLIPDNFKSLHSLALLINKLKK
jgi:acyl carrier protein